MLLATMRGETEIARERLDVDGVAGAGNRARSERQRVGLGAGGGQPIEVAPQRRHVREKEVRDEHRLRRPEMRIGRHQGFAGRRRLRRQRFDDGRHRPLQAPESGGAGTAAGRATPVRCATGQCAAGVRHRRRARPAAARRSCGHLRPRRRRTPDWSAPVSRISPSAASICAASSGVRTPAAESARAQARLPVTSSSKRRRSNRNDAPNSNAAASGAVSKRPDHKVVGGGWSLVIGRWSLVTLSWRTSRPADRRS